MTFSDQPNTKTQLLYFGSIEHKEKVDSCHYDKLHYISIDTVLEKLKAVGVIQDMLTFS